ncbi:hypothetical protein FKW77_004667 [Venturia effusa]|uniref:Uncharacterized protein n=1 Tax=Venturia effusa TaxID=50376 RepID=A0A517LQ21_9PEZI|nr:hypothetical protein FKW77_004667 [Venturia effusa]
MPIGRFATVTQIYPRTSNRLSMYGRKLNPRIKEQDEATELDDMYPLRKGDALASQSKSRDRPVSSGNSILDNYADCDQNSDSFADTPISRSPTVNEPSWEALVSGSKTTQAHDQKRASSSLSRRRSLGTIMSDRRDLCELMCEAASTGNVPQLGRLLGAGADPSKKSREGQLPVHLAAAGGHLSVLKCLAMYGAKMDAMDQLGRTALHAAVLGRQADVIPFLVQSGVPVDAKDADGRTALQLAAQMAAAEKRAGESDLENVQSNKVRFSYKFGKPKAANRASVCINSRLPRTPLEALLREGASAGDVTIEPRL